METPTFDTLRAMLFETEGGLDSCLLAATSSWMLPRSPFHSALLGYPFYLALPPRYPISHKVLLRAGENTKPERVWRGMEKMRPRRKWIHPDFMVLQIADRKSPGWGWHYILGVKLLLSRGIDPSLWFHLPRAHVRAGFWCNHNQPSV